jgi:hypothetical protein
MEHGELFWWEFIHKELGESGGALRVLSKQHAKKTLPACAEHRRLTWLPLLIGAAPVTSARGLQGLSPNAFEIPSKVEIESGFQSRRSGSSFLRAALFNWS